MIALKFIVEFQGSMMSLGSEERASVSSHDCLAITPAFSPSTLVGKIIVIWIEI
jgi:hypothetical protein